jgi:hypothetical protein
VKIWPRPQKVLALTLWGVGVKKMWRKILFYILLCQFFLEICTHVLLLYVQNYF